MSAESNLEMGCRGWPVLENQESQAWETRPESNPGRNHWHLMLHWERNLLPPVSFHFLEGKNRYVSATETLMPKQKNKSPEQALTNTGGPGTIGWCSSCVPGCHGG